MNIKRTDGKMTLESLKPNIRFSDIKSAEKISEALSIVNENLEKTQRNLTYFDVYKFYSTITSESEFVSKINELPPNMATIINTTYFTYDKQSYKQGDVVVRDNNGELIHVESISGGYYYPSALEKSNSDQTYTLHYSYSVTPATEGETTIGKGEASKTIKIEGLETEGSSNIYGFIFNKSEVSAEHKWTFSFEAAHSTGGELIRPMIKMYSKGGEEVYVDFTITLSNADNKYVYTISSVPEIVGYAVIK